MAKTIVPAGYRLTVVSWENDGDNYNTKVVEGISRERCQYLVDLCKLLHFNISSNNVYNNLYEPSDEEIEKLTDAMMDLVVKHSISRSDLPDPTNREDVRDYVIEDLYDLGLSHGEWYTRVCDDYRVELVPPGVEFEDVTKEF